jgi:hypothetical protein
MAKQRAMTKAELLADTEQAWAALIAVLDRLTEAQMTTPRDAEGWSVKDHLIHLIFWERSVIFLLKGRPRHEALGVERDLYLKGDDDEINAVIYRQHKERPLGEVLAQLKDTHQQLLQQLQPLADDDLQKAYRHYLPDDPGEGEGPRAQDVIYGNTAAHFREHLPWIEALVNEAGG